MTRATFPSSSSKSLELWFGLLAGAYLVFLQVGSFGRLLQIGPSQSYGFSDLMINYEGGFVRRGLAGEILLFISRHLALDPWKLSTVAFGIVYLGALTLFFALVMTSTLILPFKLMLVAAPTLFPFFVYGNDAYFRKDILVVFTLLVLATAVRLKSLTDRQFLWPGFLTLVSISFVLLVMIVDFAVLFLGLAAYLIAGFSHGRESGATTRGPLRRLWALPIILLPPGLVGLLSYVGDLNGTFELRLSAARERAQTQVEVWDAAFWAQMIGPHEWFSFVRAEIFQRPEVLATWLLIFLAGPVTLGVVLLWRYGASFWPLVLALGPLILLFIALDYGRWMMLLSFAVVIGALTSRWRREKSGYEAVYSPKPRIFWGALVAVALYVATWNAPVCCLGEPTVSIFRPNLVTASVDSFKVVTTG